MPGPRAQERAYRCDVHTHTLYSRHAYSTLEENVREAAERRIELLGVTEHFSDMLFPTRDLRNFQYFANLGCWPRSWHGVTLLRGVEADIVDLDGNLYGHDTPAGRFGAGVGTGPDTLKDMVFGKVDYAIASVHNHDWADGALLATTTEMYIRALSDPRVLIVGHPGRAGVPFELDPVLEAARDQHKLIEINEHSLNTSEGHDRSYVPCRRIAERCAELGVSIAVNSDAHISYDVGRFEAVPALLDELDFPADLIATCSADAFLAALTAAGLPVAL